MTILQKPDALSFSLNILPFRISSTEQVSFILYHGENEILSHLYEPNTDGVVEIDLRDIIHNRLSVILSDSSEAYEQVNLVGDFTADFGSSTYNFRVVRGGVEHLADSATNFLKQNFLTWQPTVKMVTYSCPEFLTYYSVDVSALKLKAYFVAADGTITDETINYADLAAGKAYTIPLQYACVAAKFASRLPSYYDVWVESKSGDRLTYVQRYQADNAKSLHEDWILFDNSLGGIDTFRAYGVDAMTAKHTHNVAEIAEESVEYRVDTERQHQKNTGYLLPAEARWLYDFFPSSRKYIYIDNAIRSIVVTESNVKRDNKLLPSGFSFTYKFADARPLLNLPRTEVPATMLDIQVPDLGSFTLPPRLVEIPRLPLTEGALFPVQSPYSEEWGTTTLASLATLIGELLSLSAGNGGGVGHSHNNLDLLAVLSCVENYLLVGGGKIKAGYADEAGKLTDLTNLYNQFLRKDQEDSTKFLMKFLQGIEVGEFLQGSSGIGMYQDENGSWHIETDYLDVRLKFTATEVEILHASHVGGKIINSPANMKVVKVEETDTDYICYMNVQDDEGNVVRNMWAEKDQAFCETFNLQKQADGKEGNHFLWRLVTSVGEDFIALSKIDCAENSDAPIVGDELVVLGNREKDDRQGAIIQASTGDGAAPYIRIYKGISGYALPVPKINLSPKDTKISADSITLESTGSDMESEVNELKRVSTEISSELAGSFYIWQGESTEVPTLDNEPAVDWTTDEEREKHVDDFYISTDGLIYQFKVNNGVYSWVEVKDKYVIAYINGIVTGLLETGIDIENRVITITAGKFLVRSDVGGAPIAIFEIDEETGVPVISGDYLKVNHVNIADKKVLLNPDGSGHLAGGNVTWDADGNTVYNGASRTKWKTLTYGVIYRSENLDVFGFNGSAVYNDRIKLEGLAGAELLIAWGDNADGREIEIFNKAGMKAADVKIIVPSGYKIIVSPTEIYEGGSEFMLRVGYIYYMTGMSDAWIVRQAIKIQNV